MTTEIHRSASRFLDRSGGRATWHSYSFGQHYDETNLSFGPLICHDEHLLSDGVGFEEHEHVGIEIVTWVVSGALHHVDSLGNDVVLTPGRLGWLSSGSGVHHSETAAAPQTRVVQVWLDGSGRDEPAFRVVSTDGADVPARPTGRSSGEASVETTEFTEVLEPIPGVHLSVAHVEARQSVTLPAVDHGQVFVAKGSLLRNSLAEPLGQGDALRIEDAASATLTAAVDTELLLWTF